MKENKRIQIADEKKPDLMKRSAIKFVVFMGVVSLFADMTYEGARSITGPYLAVLGASAAMVGFIAGFGELMGYSLRLVSGYLADHTGKYWLMTILGFVCNLLAVPLLAFTNNWWQAALLIILERAGRAIRTPSRDAMLSHASQRMGMGWGFGLHEALDQTGAMIGPLLVALVLYYQRGYHYAFAILIVPALLSLTMLMVARHSYPHPRALEIPPTDLNAKSLHNKAFWLYLMGAGLVGAGFADFSLMAYHFEKSKVLSTIWIPIAYAIAMQVSGLASLVSGYFYDKAGLIVLIITTFIACLFAPLVFLGNAAWAMAGLMLWSIGMGVHDSLMRAVIANMVPADKRASAYGIFSMSFGICWFLGSVLMGILYDISIPWLVIFSVMLQLAAIPILWLVMNREARA